MADVSEFFCTSPVCEGYRPLVNNRCGFCQQPRVFRTSDGGDPDRELVDELALRGAYQDDAVPLCSLCEEELATEFERWPAPVCAACDVWLDGLGADLKDLEESDPAVAEAARRLDEAIDALPDWPRARTEDVETGGRL